MVPRIRLALVAGLLAHDAMGAGLAPHFQGRFGAIEIFDSQAKLSFRVNPPRLTEALPACGTAHLLVAAAALQHGVLPVDATLRPWNAEAWPAGEDWPRRWQSEQTLDVALRYGTPWYFQELQTALGPKLDATLQRWGMKVSGSVEQWRISPLDQVEWLKKLRTNSIGLSAVAHRSLLAALTREQHNGEILYGMGGRCAQDPEYWLAWQVGWVERSGARAPAYYALNAEGRNRADLKGVGRRIARSALAEMKIWTAPLQPLPAAALTGTLAEVQSATPAQTPDVAADAAAADTRTPAPAAVKE